jgi:hypothetical protein
MKMITTELTELKSSHESLFSRTELRVLPYPLRVFVMKDATKNVTLLYVVDATK